MNDKWQKNNPQNSLSWEETVQYVKRMEDEWRLPTKDELVEAFQEKTEGFSESLYWSSDEMPETDSLWFVDFYKGIVSFCGKESKLFVRLIKK